MSATFNLIQRMRNALVPPRSSCDPSVTVAVTALCVCWHCHSISVSVQHMTVPSNAVFGSDTSLPLGRETVTFPGESPR